MKSEDRVGTDAGGPGNLTGRGASGPPAPARRSGALFARPGLLFLVGAAALVLFAGLATAVVETLGRPLLLDASSHAWSVRHRPGAALEAARAVTSTGTGAWPYTLVALGGSLMGRGVAGRLRAAACCLAFLVAGQALRTGARALIDRPRPPVEDWATAATGWSFPSGHAATSAMTAGVLIAAVWLRSPPGRGALVALLACWAAAVAVTRVYLGVHWFTDVIGGWLFALAWLCLCGVALRRGSRSVACSGAGRKAARLPG